MGESKHESGRTRKLKNKMAFTDLGLKRIKHPKKGQVLYWDAGQNGLSLLVGRRTKTFRATFKLYDKSEGRWIWKSAAIGRFGEGEMVPDADADKENIEIGKAREITRNYRALAKKQIDPTQPTQKPASTLTFGATVDQFIELYAKVQQRTWDQTERVLKGNCKSWLGKPIADITKADAYTLLDGFIAEGHGYKAGVTLAWLKTFWKWAWKRDLVASPIMDAVEIKFERGERTRVYSDDEIKATWKAADKLDRIEGGYVKLMILLAPRKTALSLMRRSHLDDSDNPTIWTTPFELTKSRKTSKKRVYPTPLPALAQRILKGILRGLPKRDDDRVFPDLPVHETKAGRPIFHGRRLLRKLIEHGAPKDLEFHAWRHTLATWLQNEGHSEDERGLTLNHSGSAGATAGYSHGYPLELKRTLLTEWSDHVQGIVQPEGVALLR